MTDIKAGDVVMVVRPMRCCGWCQDLGDVYEVTEVSREKSVCFSCGKESRRLVAYDTDGSGCALYRVIRIDASKDRSHFDIGREVTA